MERERHEITAARKLLAALEIPELEERNRAIEACGFTEVTKMDPMYQWAYLVCILKATLRHVLYVIDSPPW
jgi:hypothetical protein